MIDDSLRTGRLTLGPIGERLEEEFAARHGAAHAVAVASGTSALEIVLRSVGVDGHEVIVPANTFHATAAAVLARGRAAAVRRLRPGHPRRRSEHPWPRSSARRPRRSSWSTSAGLSPPPVRYLQALCAASGVALVEDAAHAHGSSLDGRSAGTFGVAGSFSFYPTKVMAGGEGGMIVTDDAHLADEARIYRDQGKAPSPPTSTPASATTGG